MGYRVVLFAERTDIPSGQDALDRLLDRSIDGVLVTTATLALAAGRHAADAGPAAGPAEPLHRRARRRPGDQRQPRRCRRRCTAPARTRPPAHRRGRADRPTPRPAGTAWPGCWRPSTPRASRWMRRSSARGATPTRADTSTPATCSASPIHRRRSSAATTSSAFGAIDAARSLDVRVPQDVSILGFDDVPMASWEVFRLTTVSQPLERHGPAAARMLAERIEPARGDRPRPRAGLPGHIGQALDGRLPASVTTPPR